MHRLAIAVVALALVSPLAAGPALGPSGSIARELSRVRSQIRASVPESERAALLQRLDRAETALRAQRTYQALYLLEASAEGAGAFAFAAAHPTNDFVTTWTATGAPRSHSGTSGRVPAAVDALAEAAEDRGPATYHASRPYAEDSGVDAGLYYLGESRAVMDYAAFVRAGTWSGVGRRPQFRSIAPELASFDREMTKAYETMDRASHPTYIRASAALKQARSLDDHRAFEGALFEYLLSRYLFAPLRGPAAEAATPERVAAARAALPATDDHSIAELFLQFAEEGLAGENPDLRRGAAAVLEDVIPAYRVAIAPAAPAVTPTATATVTITLVRWPFT